jgi:1-acyl-sn-glycerol-3-phosphate acyltransferase
VVPVTINNSWKTVRYGHFPLEVFVDLSIEVHQPVKNSDLPFEELFLKVEKEIKDAVIV